jgi:ABC-type multidrug transport system fused ATPase/permease subunit
MAQSKIVRDFIGEVCGQIKSKKAHGMLSSELIAHIEDQKLAYINEGMKEEEAEIKAVEQMGEPVAIGESLDFIHRPTHDWPEIISHIIIWLIAGGIVLFSAVFGLGITLSMVIIDPYNVIAAAIIGLGIILFGAFIAFSFFSFYKFISNMLFGFALVRDYKNRKKKGKLYGKNC